MDTHRKTPERTYFPGSAMPGRRIVWLGVAWSMAILAMPIGITSGGPLLPDIFPWASEPDDYIYGGGFDTNPIKNKVLYEFTGALVNIGAGALELREVTHPNLMQDVYQRIYQSEGGPPTESLIGSFQKPGSTPYGHLYLPGIAQYNLRTVLEANGVGPIVSSHDKISYGLVDSTDYDTDLPNAPNSRVYFSTSAPYLGVSVGWIDLYGRNFPGQWVEATGLADGTYWLEVIFDPYNRIQESDETNNTTRIMVDLINIPDPQIMPGDYNDDGTVNAADYTVWRNTIGNSVSAGTGADGDGDGRITTQDFTEWKLRYGDTASGAGAAFGEAPEPSSLLLVVAATGFGLLLRAWRF
jgi:hypothetical protein